MIIEVLVSLVNLVIKALGGVAGIALALLPPSPFHLLGSLNLPYLDNLNWIIPVSFMISVLGYWVGAIALYYIIQVVLRWVKVIE